MAFVVRPKMTQIEIDWLQLNKKPLMKFSQLSPKDKAIVLVFWQKMTRFGIDWW